MNDWEPDAEEEKHLRLIMSMSIDCLMGKGTRTATAYTKNLRAIADLIDECEIARDYRIFKDGRG
jgi:hypothetical protein